MAYEPSATANETAPELSGWAPESPFIADALPPRPPAAPIGSPAVAFATMEALPSPFLAEYEDSEAADGPQAAALAGALNELYDPEFEEAVTDLVNEAAAIAEDRFSFETSDPAALRTEQEHGVRGYLEPLAAAMEAALDQMIDGIGNKDLRELSEADFEAVMEQFMPGETGMPPTFDHFLKKFMSKAKKAVSAVRKVSNVLMPHKLILGRLKGLVRPLLERVLRFAVNKLPVALRPIAMKLGQKLLGAATKGIAGEGAAGLDELEGVEAASADPAAIQEELDTQLAGTMLRGEDFDREASVEAFLSEESGAEADPLGTLQAERDVFAQRIVSLPPGSDATPVVQNFVPAIMAALKIGIKIIGRPKVVNFLAGLIAKYIARYIGQQQAQALSRALVDTGLKLVGLEASPENAAGRTLAATVEETVTRVVENAPEEAWENESLLESYVFEAFEQAAAANFPDAMIRGELHEAADESGAWLPTGKKRSRYKKYSKVINATLTPQVTASVPSFGDATLQDELHDRMGVDPTQPVTARIHLYEAMAGTTLSDIARGERGNAPGSSDRAGWTQLHPLTPEAAAALLKEPRLGKKVPPAFTARRGPLAVGQRVYRVDVPGARLRMVRRGTTPALAGLTRPARTSRTRIDLDFPKGQLRIRLFYSEAEAQGLAALLRRKAAVPVLLAALRRGFEYRLRRLLSGDATRALRIIHESAPVEQFASPIFGRIIGMARRYLGPAISKAVLGTLGGQLERRLDQFGQDFIKAADADADGVTVVLAFVRPPFMEPLRKLLRGFSFSALKTLGGAVKQGLGEVEVQIHPGFVKA